MNRAGELELGIELVLPPLERQPVSNPLPLRRRDRGYVLLAGIGQPYWCWTLLGEREPGVDALGQVLSGSVQVADLEFDLGEGDESDPVIRR